MPYKSTAKTILFAIFLLLPVTTFTSAAEKSIENKYHVIYSHGFGGSKTRSLLLTKGYEQLLSFLYNQHITKFENSNYIFDPTYHAVTAFNYTDVYIDLGIYGSIPNFNTANIAQTKDITTLSKALKRTKSKPTIGYGYSRGAATWINLLGQRPTTKLAGLILEAPFAAMKNTAMFTFLRGLVNTFFDIFTFIPEETRQKSI